ncbi:hypothetical protein EOE18_13715 [Novosphingobium umbonatum]|uniref:Uncharacterized protein n=1 Tax=Novosphingobium umbonatum TaxID=1908524 RepID=A0A3S2Y7A9_9SPHN|nr:hypothetical protein [Novosphingobium umbonatum]RVU03912.1 hypothetical protein EOE18_13715 [Novosphingobium umbonatum]
MNIPIGLVIGFAIVAIIFGGQAAVEIASVILLLYFIFYIIPLKSIPILSDIALKILSGPARAIKWFIRWSKDEI